MENPGGGARGGARRRRATPDGGLVPAMATAP
jgi:hypothetical protein